MRMQYHLRVHLGSSSRLGGLLAGWRDASEADLAGAGPTAAS